MKDYNSMTWWQKLKAFFKTGHVHTWDNGHIWHPEPDWNRDSDTGFYYLCTDCGERKVESYPC